MLSRNITSTVAPTLCDVAMTPKCIQQLYKIPGTSASQSSNKLAVSGFLQEFANMADLRVCAEASDSVLRMKRVSFQKFLQTFRTDLPPNNTFTLQKIDGGTNTQTPDQAGIEAVSNCYDRLAASNYIICHDP